MSKKKTVDKKRGNVSLIWEFAGARKWEYIISVMMALLGVACQIAPYIIMIDLIRQHLSY